MKGGLCYYWNDLHNQLKLKHSSLIVHLLNIYTRSILIFSCHLYQWFFHWTKVTFFNKDFTKFQHSFILINQLKFILFFSKFQISISFIFSLSLFSSLERFMPILSIFLQSMLCSLVILISWIVHSCTAFTFSIIIPFFFFIFSIIFDFYDDIIHLSKYKKEKGFNLCKQSSENTQS